MSEPTLDTPRLRLRRITPADLPDLVALDTDPEVMRFINGGRPTTRREMEGAKLPRILALQASWPGFGFFSARRRDDGAFLGWFQFHPPRGAEDARVVELGYRLRREVWGRGYATEGSRALLDRGFAELGVERVIARALADHGASRRVMEKLGMERVETAVFPESVLPGWDEERRRMVVYAVRRPEAPGSSDRPPDR